MSVRSKEQAKISKEEYTVCLSYIYDYTVKKTMFVPDSCLLGSVLDIDITLVQPKITFKC